MKKDDFFSIILGSDENAYGTTRLFHDPYNLEPLLMCKRLLVPTYYSNLCTVKQIDNFDFPQIFVNALKEELQLLHKKYEKILVIPCSDYYCELLVNNYNSFDGLIANKFISPQLLQTFYSKDKFYKLCDKHGMDYPKTYVATFENRENAVDELPFDFPIVVKPDNSNSFEYLHAKFEGKKKVYFFKDKNSYLKLIKSMNTCNYKGNLIIQEFITGGDDMSRVINSYSDNNSIVRASALGQPILEEYAPLTLGNYAAIISRYDKTIYSKVTKFLEAIGYVGFSNIDMRYDPKTNKYLIFEINPRLGRSSFYIYGTGINIMQVLVDDIIYGKTQECIYGKETSLWLNVPKSVIKKYVSNIDLKNEAKQLIKEKKSFKTLLCKGDKNIKREAYIKRYYNIQQENFKKYHYKKGL